MTGECANDLAKAHFLHRRQHPPFKIAEPNDGCLVMGKNGSGCVGQGIQRSLRQIEYICWLRMAVGVDCKH